MIIKNPAVSRIPELKALWKEAFGDTDRFIDAFFRSAFSEERSLCAIEEDSVAAALYFFDCEFGGKKIAYLYAIATKKEYRGRGYCSTLMEHTHKELKKLGYVGAILVPANKDLFAFYERLGYETSSYIEEFTETASDKKISVFEIGAEEYAKRRRELLPRGSVIQEAENLRLLELTVRFYAGENFIAAVRLGEKKFSAAEFLGDKSATSDFVYSLGYTEGTFRTYGSAIPFSMYYSFSSEEKEKPSYLGFAFD